MPSLPPVSLGLAAATVTATTSLQRPAGSEYYPEDHDASWDVTRFKPRKSSALNSTEESGISCGCGLLGRLQQGRHALGSDSLSALSDEQIEMIVNISIILNKVDEI